VNQVTNIKLGEIKTVQNFFDLIHLFICGTKLIKLHLIIRKIFYLFRGKNGN